MSDKPPNKISQLRRLSGLTQQQLSDKSGISIFQVRKIEYGEIKLENITLKNAYALAKALDISMEELLEKRGK